MTCLHPHAQYIERPDTHGRKHYVTIFCGACMKFVGHRDDTPKPPPTRRAKKSKPKEFEEQMREKEGELWQ